MYCFSNSLTVCQSKASSLAASFSVDARHRPRRSPEVTQWRSAKVTLLGTGLRLRMGRGEHYHPRRRRDRAGEMEGEASSSTPQACRPAAGGNGTGQGLTTEGR